MIPNFGYIDEPFLHKVVLDREFQISANEKRLYEILNKAQYTLLQSNHPNKFFTPELDSFYFIVGGYVRDKLLGLEAKDIDIICVEEYLSNFVKKITDISKQTIDRSFFVKSTRRVLMERGAAKNSELYKIKLSVNDEEFDIDLRSASSDLQEDYKTRDLTINSIYFYRSSTDQNVIIYKPIVNYCI